MKFSKRSLERGAGLVEYALILALVAVLTISILALFGENIADQYACIVHEMGAESGAGVYSVYSYTLIDPGSNEAIKRAQCGGMLNLTELTGGGANFRVDSAPSVNSLTFMIEGPDGYTDTRTENSPPFAVYGNNGSNYHSSGTLAAGRYTVTATTDTGESSRFIFVVE
ncbi:MAG: hypothetical protein AAF653_02445 [Chloroflexota bacterium]